LFDFVICKLFGYCFLVIVSLINMYILGLNCYAHEASACLLKDGRVCSLIEEERFNREKHTWKYPAQAIEACLAMEGITINDVDRITFYWQPYKEFTENLSHFLKYLPESLNLLKAPSGSSELTFSKRVLSMYGLPNALRKHLKLSQKPKVEFIEHHLAHAASCFFVSPFEEAAILTIDGRGESITALSAFGKGNKIKKLSEIKVPNSLGHLYAALTAFLGFKPLFDEWKVMGMSAYGKDRYKDVFADILKLKDHGRFDLNLKYFKFHTHGQGCWVSPYFIEKLGPPRESKAEYDQRHFDIACSLQRRVEEAGVHMANHLYERTQCPNLCMTGGVVLNCLMNKKIIERTPFKNFFTMPIANDAGTSMGSALFYYHQTLNKKREFVFENIFLGPEYDNEAIERVLKEKNVVYQKSAQIAKDTARCISQGNIVGWFQGRMEAGPRALGHRSIVVDPRDSKMKDRLNLRVKKREYYRPFAPSVLEEKVNDLFVMPKGQLSPYMILIGDVKEGKQNAIPAVTHADGTARVHTVNKKQNPLYWELISEFEKITGVPVILNTSFNENEPIVNTPEEAVNCFLRTDFDVLAIGDYLVTKDKRALEGLVNINYASV